MRKKKKNKPRKFQNKKNTDFYLCFLISSMVFNIFIYLE